MNIQISLSKLEEKLATGTWAAAVAVGETKANSVEEYIESLIEPEVIAFVNDRVSTIVASWAPVDSQDVKERKDALAEKLAVIPEEKLAQIEAILDSDTAI